MTKELDYNKLKSWIIEGIMILIPLMKFISFTLQEINIIDFPLLSVFVLWISIPLLLIIYIVDLKNKNFDKFDILIYLLTITGIISTILTQYKNISFLGQDSRNEGLLTLISYYLLFLVSKNIKDQTLKNKMIKIFLIIGIVHVIYSIFQVYMPFDFIRLSSRFPYLAMGLCGNANFLGSYMSMLVIYSLSKYITTKEKKYIYLLIIYTVGLTLAQSSGPFYAVIISIIFMFFYFKENRKNLLKGTLIIFLTFLITDISSLFVQEVFYNAKIEPEYNIIKELIDTIKKIIGSSNSDEEELLKLGNRRLAIWIRLLPCIPKYWLFGSGLDTVMYIYPQEPLYLIDKAHNIYLQILVTNGLPALSIYCAICLIIFLTKIKEKDINTKALYMMFVVYSVQGFLNISVVEVAPYFFIILGMLAKKE